MAAIYNKNKRIKQVIESQENVFLLTLILYMR